MKKEKSVPEPIDSPKFRQLDDSEILGVFGGLAAEPTFTPADSDPGDQYKRDWLQTDSVNPS